jgi:hypothetical protein
MFQQVTPSIPYAALMIVVIEFPISQKVPYSTTERFKLPNYYPLAEPAISQYRQPLTIFKWERIMALSD